ncbi:DUF5665 domain-containing protein [Anaerobacterium chartisolvens]|nr:DUF5665 domain-containing protein [Anaerobacterium chartisolvens]
MMFGKTALLKVINKKLDKISLNMERFKLVDYVHFLEHPRKMFWPNFLGGLARGFGIAIGFTLLGALIVYLLQIIVKWNLPIIGEFISEIIEIVQDSMNKTGGRIGG